MSTSHIVTLLTQERDRIQAAIDVLGGDEGAMPDSVKEHIQHRDRARTQETEGECLSTAQNGRRAKATLGRNQCGEGCRCTEEGTLKENHNLGGCHSVRRRYGIQIEDVDCNEGGLGEAEESGGWG